MKIRRMRTACWIPKFTNTHTHSQYVILIASPLQQWFQERPLNVTLYIQSVLLSFNIILKL